MPSGMLVRDITPDKREAWSKGNAIAWANEGHEIAARIIYGKLPHGGILPDSYEAEALPIVNEQLERAGVRLDQMRSRIFDKQYDFMLHPGEWEPDLQGKTTKDLSDLLREWLGHDKAITILDLSGVPSSVLLRLIGGILNIIYEALFWAREMPEGGRQRPQLIVMEEAHRYVGKEIESSARSMVQRIVKEGRKFGIGAMIVSQRPTEIDETILLNAAHSLLCGCPTRQIETKFRRRYLTV